MSRFSGQTWGVFVHPPRNTEELKNRKFDRATALRAWAFGRPYRKQLAMYLTVTVIGTFFGVVPAFLFRSIIDGAIPDKDRTKLAWLIVAMVAIAGFSAVLSFVARWSGAVLGEGIIADLRTALFKQVGRMPISFFTRTQTGSLMSRLNNDVIGAQQAFTFILRSTVTDVLTVVMTTAAMLQLNWVITLLAFLIVPPLIVISRRVGKVQEKAAREQMRLNGELHSTMTERFNVAGALLVMLFGHRKDEDDKFSKTASSVAAIGVRRAITGMSLTIGLPLIGSIGVAAVYWWGSRQVIDDEMKVGTMVAMATLVQRLYGPLTDLASARVDLATAFVSFDRIFEVLDAPQPIVDRPDAKVLPTRATGATVQFNDVRFAYPDQTLVASLESANQRSTAPGDAAEVLKGISFTAAAGSFTAIVGSSGAGKSTISSLLPRLYDVTGGSVLVDGIDVRELSLESLRDAVGVVSQDAHMFHSSIAENLRYVKPDATDAQLEAAARDANIHDMIASLPEGYNTIVGERGYRLSGGEKQRLALARVLLKAPRLVILDEATAHLDSETEALVQEALDRALQGRTTIAIAHRLATVQHADQILVIDDGVIAERGTHAELVAQGGIYAGLRSAQELTAA
jgi:ATP-binding cassette, subfamily B, bacterial